MLPSIASVASVHKEAVEGSGFRVQWKKRNTIQPEPWYLNLKPSIVPCPRILLLNPEP
jgi:hypothetical protein